MQTQVHLQFAVCVPSTDESITPFKLSLSYFTRLTRTNFHCCARVAKDLRVHRMRSSVGFFFPCYVCFTSEFLPVLFECAPKVFQCESEQLPSALLFLVVFPDSFGKHCKSGSHTVWLEDFVNKKYKKKRKIGHYSCCTDKLLKGGEEMLD